MVDIVYVLGGGSPWQNNEIRYSLRSIEKHLTNFKNVYVVGILPGFLKNVIHIPFDDSHPCKETNIYRKVLRACEEAEISDNFLFFNDDHFLLDNFDAECFPFFYKTDLVSTINKMPTHNRYRKAVINTFNLLHAMGHTTKNFDTHTPMLYNKRAFPELMAKHDWSNRISYVVKSLYANSFGVDGVREPDCKLNYQCVAEEIHNHIRGRKVWSIGNNALGSQLHLVLDQLYPNPSRWE